MCPSKRRAKGCVGSGGGQRQRPTQGGSEMKRTTHRSASGKKLYAVRDAKGRFKDIQTFKRAHGQDVKRKGKKER